MPSETTTPDVTQKDVSATKKRKRQSIDTKDLEDPSKYPELQLDNDSVDHHSNLVFKEPLFKKPSNILSIAYSHHSAATQERKYIRSKKKTAMKELHELHKLFQSKKKEVLDMNKSLKASSQTVGKWTSKVFELELQEPNCTWNEKLTKLKQFKAQHGRLPEMKRKNDKIPSVEKELALWIAGIRTKVNKRHKTIMNYPHRIQVLEELGIQLDKSADDVRFDAMFNKFLAYRREHGTWKMPSASICKESGDEELLLLHNWLYSVVSSYRYHLHTKKVKDVQRFLDLDGFSFEQPYATNGHVFTRDTPPFDDICRRYVENNGVMIESDKKILAEASNKSPSKGKKRGPNKKNRKKKENDDGVQGLKANDEVKPSSDTLPIEEEKIGVDKDKDPEETGDSGMFEI